MNATNLNIVLTNALCCISTQAVKVSKLYSIGDKCADSELQKLKLMNDWFEALRCYNANTSVNSEFVVRFLYDDYINYITNLTNPLRNYTLSINGVESTLPGDGVKTKAEIFIELLDIALPDNNYHVIIDPDTRDVQHVYVYITGLCDTDTIDFITSTISTGDIVSTISWAKFKNGQCTVLNCLTETDFNTLIAKLMKECDICECQLNQ